MVTRFLAARSAAGFGGGRLDISATPCDAAFEGVVRL